MSVYILLFTLFPFQARFNLNLKSSRRCVCCLDASIYMKNATSKVSKKNNVPSTTVALTRTASKPLAFCLPTICSAPPDMAPDKPALFPDCNKTAPINKIETITSKMDATASTLSTSKQTYKPSKIVS